MISSAGMSLLPIEKDQNNIWITRRLAPLRKRISNSGDWAGLPVGLTFLVLAFSVGTWHWWLEHKVGIYVWVVCVTVTFVSYMIAPDRDTPTVLLIFGASYVSVGRTWQWFRGEMPIYVPILWIAGVAFLLWVTPRKKMASIAALGMWALFSLKAVLLDREPRALFITAISLALIVGIVLTAKDSDS